MTQIRIDAVKKSASGKAWQIRSGNEWYTAYLDSGINEHVGKTLEVEIKTFGKDGKAIDKYKVVGDVASTPRQPALDSNRGAPWWSNFVSNQVAHAISAGLIKGPEEIKVWTLAAKQAVESADSDVPL
jgi:hypothetical protein